MKRLALGALGVASSLSVLLAPGTTQNAVANGDTRTLYLYHAHTRESIEATFMVNGHYDQAVLEKLNWFLRDWRRDEPTKMDPRLFDVVWETYRASGSQEPVQIVSAYRSPETNAMLRRRSKAVAEFSQHMLGKAMDMHYVDVPMSRIREIGMKMQRGGVGYYPTAGTPFVHLDVGNVRAWPRMSYDQLARLFPDGKTVHLPSNGQPLARYEEARAEILARNNGSEVPTVAEVRSKSIFASLFGWGDEEEAAAAPPPSGPRSHVAALMASRNGRNQPAAAPVEEEPRRSVVVERAERDLPRGETFLSAPEPVAQAANNARQLAAPDPRLASAKIVDAPLPPRRPTELASLLPQLNAPLPPSRPTDLIPRPQVAEARPQTQRPTELPAVITGGTGGPVAASAANLPIPAGLLAYAPSTLSPALNAAVALTEAPKPPVRSIALRPSLAPPSAQPVGVRAAALARRPMLVPARLDRSNFRVLTSSARIANAEGNGMGPAAAPIRAAARMDLKSVAFSGSANVVTRFMRGPGELGDSRFTGSAVQALPRLDAAMLTTPARDTLN